MIQVIDKQGSYLGPTLFFVAVFIIGKYLLLNLSLAIVLKFISSEDDDPIEGDGDEIKNESKPVD